MVFEDYLGVMQAIGQYLDTLRRTEDGWRICRRVIIAHGM